MEVSKITSESTIVESSAAHGKFIERVGQMQVVESALETASSSYTRLKQATPATVKTAIDGAEIGTRHALEATIALLHKLPLPLSYADAVACSALDKVEILAEYRQQLLLRWRTHVTSASGAKLEDVDSSPLTDEEKNFYYDVLKFVAAVKDYVPSAVSGRYFEAHEVLSAKLTGLYSTLVQLKDEVLGDKSMEASILNKAQREVTELADRFHVYSSFLWSVVGEAPKVVQGMLNNFKKTILELTPGNINKLILENLTRRVQLIRDLMSATKIPIAEDSERKQQDLAEEVFPGIFNSLFPRVLGTFQKWLPLSVQQRVAKFFSPAIEACSPVNGAFAQPETDNTLENIRTMPEKYSEHAITKAEKDLENVKTPDEPTNEKGTPPPVEDNSTQSARTNGTTNGHHSSADKDGDVNAHHGLPPRRVSIGQEFLNESDEDDESSSAEGEMVKVDTEEADSGEEVDADERTESFVDSSDSVE